jgi:hypothetical protein
MSSNIYPDALEEVEKCKDFLQNFNIGGEFLYQSQLVFK